MYISGCAEILEAVTKQDLCIGVSEQPKKAADVNTPDCCKSIN